MDPAEYAKLDRLEERMWWFAAMHANLLMPARDFDSSAAPDRVLDAGCGSGGLPRKVAAVRPEAMMVGLGADRSGDTRAGAPRGYCTMPVSGCSTPAIGTSCCFR